MQYGRRSSSRARFPYSSASMCALSRATTRPPRYVQIAHGRARDDRQRGRGHRARAAREPLQRFSKSNICLFNLTETKALTPRYCLTSRKIVCDSLMRLFQIFSCSLRRLIPIINTNMKCLYYKNKSVCSGLFSSNGVAIFIKHLKYFTLPNLTHMFRRY